MSDVTMNRGVADASPRPHLDEKPHIGGAIAFLVVLLAGLAYAAYSIATDVNAVGEHDVATGAFVLLGIALLIALGFEFVNGFHDTANAVATVIYTHSLPPLVAVVWSGFFNFLGVLTSSGAVAFSIITLLPVELILQVGSGAGYAMIFALLIAAIIWNLGTWAMGLPNSSSHALIGSIMGVGLANQFMARGGSATSGVDWNQAVGVFKALLFSPVLGFVLAALLLLAMKAVIRSKALYTAPEGNKPPPGPIRGLLILTCTAVSFFHGSNDGQKGMGLIMLILIGVVPTAYALNRAIPETETPAFLSTAHAAQGVFKSQQGNAAPPASAAQAREIVGDALKAKKLQSPEVYAALNVLTGDIGRQVQSYGSLKDVPAEATANVRNDMFLASDAIRLMGSHPTGYSEGDVATLKSLRTSLDSGTKFIPNWVKVAVALALGLGTMVGWKRIVVTVGEKIGKTHLT
jgi:inorganic phosphate transporter, PiT family